MIPDAVARRLRLADGDQVAFTADRLEYRMQHTLRFRACPTNDVASEAWRHIDILRQIRNHAVRNYYPLAVHRPAI